MGEGHEQATRTGGGDRDAKLLVALRHDLRRGILRAMLREDGPVSPLWLSTELKEPLSNVSYHVRVLVDNEGVALVDTKPVRGSMQHFYRPAIEEPWALAVLGVGEDKATSASDHEASTAEEPSR